MVSLIPENAHSLVKRFSELQLMRLITQLQTIYNSGMDNRTTLDQVSKSYRMPLPTGKNINCPTDFHELMLLCWTKEADRRPTFDYLKSVFEDFNVATEGSYDEGGAF